MKLQREVTMKSKLMIAFGALAVAATLTFSMAASPTPPQDYKIKMPLACQRALVSSDVIREMSLTNNTGAAVPQGTKVYWKTSDNEEGQIVLRSQLANGSSIKVQDNRGEYQYTCQAWFLK